MRLGSAVVSLAQVRGGDRGGEPISSGLLCHSQLPVGSETQGARGRGSLATGPVVSWTVRSFISWDQTPRKSTQKSLPFLLFIYFFNPP